MRYTQDNGLGFGNDPANRCPSEQAQQYFANELNHRK